MKRRLAQTSLLVSVETDHHVEERVSTRQIQNIKETNWYLVSRLKECTESKSKTCVTER